MRVLMSLLLYLTVGFAQSDSPMGIPKNEHPLPVVGFGNPSAPVKVVMYYSLTCRHCSEFKLHQLPDFKKKYIDPGYVYFILKDFPTDEFSLKLAILCWAGRNTQKYLERSLLLTQNFNPEKDKDVKYDWVNAEYPAQVVEKLLAPTGIRPDMIQPLFDDRALEDAILHDPLTAGKKLGLTYAPGFTVNGKLVEMKNLDDAVDEATKAELTPEKPSHSEQPSPTKQRRIEHAA